jgi:hypothetical protein
MNIYFEAPDRTGKDSQIKKLVSILCHDKPTHILHYCAIKAKTPKESLYLSKQLYTSMFRLILNPPLHCNFILNRAHIGEAVYALKCRGYSGDYVFDLEKEVFAAVPPKIWKDQYLVTFVDAAENLVAREDGDSHSVTIKDKQADLDSFRSAVTRSYIPNKIIINIENKNMEQVHDELCDALHIKRRI